MTLKYFILFICFIVIGCSKKSLDKEDYIKFVEAKENDITQQKVISDVEYLLTLCPIDYVIAKEFKVENILEKNYEHKKKDLLGYHYFKLRIQSKNKNEEIVMLNTNNENEVKERYEYFSYGFEENLFMIRNNKQDTIPVALYHFERTYGVVPYIDFLFSFKKDTIIEKNDKKIQILINDNVFNNIILTYEFDKLKFNNSPKLKLY